MKILSIVGARPEFIQSACVSRELRKIHKEVLVHTGQHYDYSMSQAFFDEIGLPVPDYNLESGSGSHAKQTADILTKLEDVLFVEKPDCVVIRGDTNSTLAGAIAASKLNIPVAHIEAGERSFDKRMPEEINRLASDRLADLHFCVSQTAVNHLAKEGISKSVHWVGDVMYDAMLANLSLAREKSRILFDLGLQKKAYALATVHRAANTDNKERLKNIVDILNNAPDLVVFPAHPRTVSAIKKYDLNFSNNVRMINPVGYFDMMILEENARMIATDSGGVQREAYFMSIPCLTLRDETEWFETVEMGWNKLVGVQTDLVLQTWKDFTPPREHPPIFGDGNASSKISAIISSTF